MPQHSMLTGIYQTVFLHQWGVPEIKMSLDRLQGFYKLDVLLLDHEPSEEDHTVWIYEKRDKILFFKRGKLLSHFKWNEFKERWKATNDETVSQSDKKIPPLMGTALSLVA
jgi:hypothetical protein